jgi:hypothetical protein
VEAVSGSLDDATFVGPYNRAQDLVVAGEGFGYRLGVTFPHLGGTLYVREQEGDRACWRVSHWLCCPPRFPLWGHYSSGALPGPCVHQVRGGVFAVVAEHACPLLTYAELDGDTPYLSDCSPTLPRIGAPSDASNPLIPRLPAGQFHDLRVQTIVARVFGHAHASLTDGLATR